MAIDLEALKGKLSSLTSIKKSNAASGDAPGKPAVAHTDYFDTLFINDVWYGRRHGRCYPLVVSFCAMSNSHFKYEKPKSNSILNPGDVVIELEPSDYYMPCANWTPFRKGWQFKGKVLKNVVLVDANNIDNQKWPKDD